MILYLSYATDSGIFNGLLREGKIKSGNAVQKFNDSIMRGLSQHEELVSVAAVGYGNVPAERIETTRNGIRYIVIENKTGRLHKFWNLMKLWQEGCKIIRAQKPSVIFCDAIATSPCYVSKLLGKCFRIPVIGIVTDLPGTIGGGSDAHASSKRMQGFDAYILLTEAMNEIVNPTGKPYMVMEGLGSPDMTPAPILPEKERIILYTGSMMKQVTGIEYFVEGFLKADLADCALHFYGVGNLVDQIREIGKTHPQIKYMGNLPTDKIVEKQSSAALLINPRPSDQEFCKYSFPSKTIEYMASGVPVLMTRLPGAPKEYFDYVFTIEPETAEGACKALRDIFAMSEGSRQAFGMAARTFIFEQKSCDAQTKRMFDFSKTIAN